LNTELNNMIRWVELHVSSIPPLSVQIIPRT